MRVLLAGSLFSGNSLFSEIEAYLSKGHEVVVNTSYVSELEENSLQSTFGDNTTVSFCSFDPSSPEQLQQVISEGSIGFDAIIYPPNIEGFTPDVLAAATREGLSNKLKVIGCPNDATSHLSAVYQQASTQGVSIINSPGIHADAVAEYTLSQIGYHARRIGNFYKETGESGHWPHREALTLTHSLKGKTLGVLGGSGNDGAAVILLAKKMGLNVLSMGSGSEAGNAKIIALGADVAPDLQTLVSRSDFISVNCRKNDQTIGLITEEVFGAMRSGVIIINPAGAEIIDKKALFNEMSKPVDTRRVGAIILDMPYGGKRDETAFSCDPDNARLKEMGVLFTPRMAGYTVESGIQGVVQLSTYVNALLAGEPIPIPVVNQPNRSIRAPTTKTIEVLDDEGVKTLVKELTALMKEGGQHATHLRDKGLVTKELEGQEDSLTTNADIAVALHISDGLAKKGYRLNFSGEEQPPILNPNSDIEIIIDGIDGTRNFRDGNFGWSISVAIKKDGQLIAGVVHDPKCEETYWAIKGMGAQFSDRHSEGPLVIPEDHPKDFSFSVGSFQVKGSTEVKGKIIEDMKRLGGRQREWGSVALSICAAARGGLGCFIQGNSKPHDHLAGIVIAEEAGAGVLVSPSRDPDKSDIIVAHPKLIGPTSEIYNRRTVNVPAKRPDNQP